MAGSSSHPGRLNEQLEPTGPSRRSPGPTPPVGLFPHLPAPPARPEHGHRWVAALCPPAPIGRQEKQRTENNSHPDLEAVGGNRTVQAGFPPAGEGHQSLRANSLAAMLWGLSDRAEGLVS